MTYKVRLVAQQIPECAVMEGVPGEPLLITVAMTPEQLAALEVELRVVYAKMRKHARKVQS